MISDYAQYGRSALLAQVLQDNVKLRFSTERGLGRSAFPGAVADVVIDLIEQIAQSRNLARFG